MSSSDPKGRLGSMRPLSVLALALLVACGGDATGSGNPPPPPPPPPPTPVVTTVTVSPATVTLVEESTASLTATVKDQEGAVMSGQTVDWSSSALAIATVSSSGMVTGAVRGERHDHRHGRWEERDERDHRDRRTAPRGRYSECAWC